MNKTNPTDPADTPSKASEPSAPEQTAPVEAKGALDAAKEKARAAAEGVKDFNEKFAKHGFKAELCETFSETKKNPSSLWKKPDTLRPGKGLAVVGLAASVVLLLLLLVTSSSFFGLVCLVLGLGALLFSALGLKTEGRKLAVGGSVVGFLVVLCALGQTFGSSSSGSAADSPNGSESVDGAPSDADLQPLAANDGPASSSIDEILSKAETANRIGSLNFHGFYTGMSLVDAKALAEHYGVQGNDAVFFHNLGNGEVYLIHLSPSALFKIAEFPNDYEQAVLDMMAEVGSSNWFENTLDASHTYRTADGVVVSMNGIAWLAGNNKAFYIEDSQRARSAKEFNSMFRNNNDMRKEALALKQKGANIRLFTLPGNVEFLIKEVPDMNLWVSAFPPTDAQCRAMQSKRNDEAPDEQLIAGLNALPAVQAAGLVFRSPKSITPTWKEFSYKPKALDKLARAWSETKESSPATTWEEFLAKTNEEREAMSLGPIPPLPKGLFESVEKGLIGKEGKENTHLVAETRNLVDDPTAKESHQAE